MKLLSLTTFEGKPVVFNPKHIIAVHPDDSEDTTANTAIHVIGSLDEPYIVQQGYDAVVTAMESI